MSALQIMRYMGFGSYKTAETRGTNITCAGIRERNFSCHNFIFVPLHKSGRTTRCRLR
jgi:hypothetical protein